MPGQGKERSMCLVRVKNLQEWEGVRFTHVCQPVSLLPFGVVNFLSLKWREIQTIRTLPKSDTIIVSVF